MDYIIQDSTLSDIADAIRAKTGETDEIQTAAMASKIDGISTGGYLGSWQVLTSSGTSNLSIGDVPEDATHLLTPQSFNGEDSTAYLVPLHQDGSSSSYTDNGTTIYVVYDPSSHIVNLSSGGGAIYITYYRFAKL